MAEVRINSGQLTTQTFFLPNVMSELADGSSLRPLSLEPGTYQFQHRREAVPNFEFYVTQDGKIDYEKVHDPYLAGRGSGTLVVRGLQVLIEGCRIRYIQRDSAAPRWPRVASTRSRSCPHAAMRFRQRLTCPTISGSTSLPMVT